MGKKKITLDEAKQEFINRGLIPLFDNYKNCDEKLLGQTQEGYLINISFYNLKLGKTPNIFDAHNPYTIQNIKLWCKLNNKTFELLSEEYIGTFNKLKWKCLKEDCGEIFEIAWTTAQSNHGCGFCKGFQAGLSNCLTTKNPELAKQWHPTLNGDLTPYDVTEFSNKKVWWQCDKGHEWEDQIISRSKYIDCPYCNHQRVSKEYNLLVINPVLSKEWDYNKNKKRPEDFLPNSDQKIWWQCCNNPKHKWEAPISRRNGGRKSNCPYCAGKLPSEDYNLLVYNPELCKEWDYKKNKKKPEDYTPGSNKKVWWICKDCEFNWQADISNRNYSGNGCPRCSESKGEKQLDIILTKYNILHDSQYTFDDLIGTGGGLLKFDVPIFWDEEKTNLRMLIEYDGKQHFEWIKGMMTKKAFEKLQIHDELKNQYCKNNNIKLLRIPYWDFDNIENILKKEGIF